MTILFPVTSYTEFFVKTLHNPGMSPPFRPDFLHLLFFSFLKLKSPFKWRFQTVYEIMENAMKQSRVMLKDNFAEENGDVRSLGP